MIAHSTLLELETLFREDSATTKIFRRYTKVVGLPYLWSTLAHVLNDLKQDINKQAMQGNDITMHSLPDEDYHRESSATAFELDPSRLTDMDDEKINKLNLVRLTKMMGDSIGDSIAVL
jgi:hypothetical protein